jgi:GTP-binding protein EngB required for normal cell division
MTSEPERGILSRLEDLEIALAAGDGRLDPDALRQGRELVARIGDRLRLGSERTIVALAGATGSGKSSMFNALAGMELAEVGVRRPTTGQAGACVWTAEGADPLLDWLEVPRRQRTNRESVLDGTRQSDLHGLVLLDLPDHDSTQIGHRLEVDRLVELVDLLIWVVDPQKYADAALHAYLRKLRGHASVMLVVLNQADTLDGDELRTCAGDLRRLLDADGLGAVVILTTSARTGTGVRELRALIADLVEHRDAFVGRARADLDAVVARLRPGVAEAEPDPAHLPGTDRLIAALSDAAGVSVVVDAIAGDYLRRYDESGGRWLPRWKDWLRPDPLDRLGLTPGDAATMRGLASSAEPRTAPVQRERVELAVRDLTAATADGLPSAWSDAVRSAAVPTTDELSDTLDAAVGSVDLTLRRPVWWQVAAAVQALLLAAAAVGLLWWPLTVAGVGAPRVGGLSVPLLIFLGGAVLGAAAVVLARWSARVGARRRRESVASTLNATVSAVAVERVVAPISSVIIDHRSVRVALSQ